MNGKRIIVGVGIPVMFAPLEHEEDGSENLVAHSVNRALVTTPDDEGLKLRLEYGRGATGGMSKFAE